MAYKKTEKGWESPRHGKIAEIGVLFEVSQIDGKKICTLHKHGALPEIAATYEIWKRAMPNNDLRLVDATRASEEDLNHILDTSALPPSHYERLNPIELERKKTKIKKAMTESPDDLEI